MKPLDGEGKYCGIVAGIQAILSTVSSVDEGGSNSIQQYSTWDRCYSKESSGGHSSFHSFWFISLIHLGTRNPKDQPLWVSCRDYGWKSWYCPIANCQVVNPRDTSSATSLKAYTFEHCEVYPKTNQSTTDATISVQSFFAHNGHGVSVVKSTPTKESPHKVHVCRFQDRNSMNNVRPWCSGCVYWEWDEVDWTPLLSKPV
ncbi:hypothetical protein PCANC_09663 [Puccinia coronata f. sp. avenae]|uniref:Uncharacterized protein n=1 Tax=Puccinia coronata f. sp. avenae TaxID=200324 RepID=A0A2N5VAT9_9BASI|nr:hypothetical protein PCANC_09663 [Puccinia coronata f. sp. avenae]